MDRESVEDLVHSALGRQLRVTCLLGLLFLGVGFVMGHMVAAQHARDLGEHWSQRADQLTDQVNKVETKLQSELIEVRQLAASQQALVNELTAKLAQHDVQVLDETRRLAKATEELRRSLVARCIAETQQEKARMLRELQPYVDRRMTLKASEVTEAVNRLVDSQISHLKSLAQAEPQQETRLQVMSSLETVPAATPAIAPVSAESGACPPPHLTALTPVAEQPEFSTTVAPRPVAPRSSTVSAPAVSEAVTPVPAIEAPMASTPSAPGMIAPITPRGSTGKPLFFPAPVRPRLFIPAGKSAAVKTADQIKSPVR